MGGLLKTTERERVGFKRNKTFPVINCRCNVTDFVTGFQGAEAENALIDGVWVFGVKFWTADQFLLYKEKLTFNHLPGDILLSWHLDANINYR